MRRRDQNGHYGDLLGDLEWIQLAQYRDWWRYVVNMVINLRMVCATELVGRLERN
jgi:hypothetical protein